MTMDSDSNQDAVHRWEHLCGQPKEAEWWDWYALMRLIQCANPGLPRIGHGLRLADDPVRLGQPPFFHTPPFPVAALKRHGPSENANSEAEQPMAGGGEPPPAVPDPYASAVPWLYSYHFGLFGPFGPLPLHLTELANSRDPAFASFCNVLHHRFLSFFFRAWADARKETQMDRAAADEGPPSEQAAQNYLRDAGADGERPWDLYVGSLIGLGLPSLRHRDRVPDHAKLFYAGRLIQPSRNAEGLCAILEDYFQVPARVITFVGRTVRLPQSIRCSLGASGGTGLLGFSILVGETYQEHQLGFRIRLGPMGLDTYEHFLPGSSGFGELHDWVRLYTGLENDPNPRAGLEAVWDLQLVLFGPEVPGLILGRGLRLGYTTWLNSHPVDRDVADLVLQPLADFQPIAKTQNDDAALNAN